VWSCRRWNARSNSTPAKRQKILLDHSVPNYGLTPVSITLCAERVGQSLHQHGLIEAVNATAGLVIFSVALVILQLKKVALADYLPSLIYAAVIKWLWP